MFMSRIFISDKVSNKHVNYLLPRLSNVAKKKIKGSDYVL